MEDRLLLKLQAVIDAANRFAGNGISVMCDIFLLEKSDHTPLKGSVNEDGSNDQYSLVGLCNICLHIFP